MEVYESSKMSKVIFAGLDKAGKSSIILTLKNETAERCLSLTPTRAIERKEIDFMDKKVIAWDFGGQLTYRKEYLKNPINYFDRTKVCIYVIDIQDTRYEESLSYLRGIIGVLKKFDLKCKISILFHKMDPEFESKKQKKLNKTIIKISKELNSMIHKKYELQLFSTSIYREDSICEAFSKILEF